MLHSLSFGGRLRSFKRTELLTFISGSRPRGPGFHFARAAEVTRTGEALATPLLIGIGEETGATGDGLATAGAMDVTPAHVFGVAEVAGDRSTNFSARNTFVKFMICRPVLWSSRTAGGPSNIVIRWRSSGPMTSSRKGAYPASWEMPRSICLQL